MKPKVISEQYPAPDPIGEVRRTRDHIEECLGNPQLLADWGFASRESVERVIHLIVAGDFIDPFKGPNWRTTRSTWRSMRRRIGRRNTLIEKHLEDLIECLRGSKSEREVCRLAETAFPFQVVFPAFNETELLDALKSIADRGAGCWPFDAGRIVPLSRDLVFVEFEEHSYWI